jgi:hypothetical protein
MVPLLQNRVRTTYEGPLGLDTKYNLPKPSAISIAWDFIMYNVSGFGFSMFEINLFVFLASMLWR